MATGETGTSLIAMKGYTRWIGSSGESGTYCIIGDDGTLYIPSEMDAAFRHNGLYVRFTAEEIRRNAMISRTQGTVVRLLDIEIYNRV